MKQKLVELQNKRSELIARSKTAAAQQQVHAAVKSIDILDPTSEIGRFEDKIRREEAKARPIKIEGTGQRKEIKA